MNIVICDDDKIFREKLENIINGILINNNLNSDVILSTDNPNDVLNYIESEHQVTLYFLDIVIKDSISGITIATLIREKDTISPIVLITNYPNYINLTYEYRIRLLDFIHKGDMESCQKKIEDCIMIANHRQINGYANCLNIYTAGKYCSIPYENIYYIETIPGTHKLVLHANNGFYEFYGKIKDLQKTLADDFVKCYKSILVNRAKIIGADKRKKEIILYDGYHCPYSLTHFNPSSLIDRNTYYVL